MLNKETPGNIDSATVKQLDNAKNRTRRKMIGYGTAAVISLTGIGFCEYKAFTHETGVDLPRPSQTELDQAAPIVHDYNEKVRFFEFCKELYKDTRDCQSFRVAEPDDKIKDAQMIVGQEEAFKAETSKDQSIWPILALPLAPIAGVGVGGFLHNRRRYKEFKNELDEAEKDKLLQANTS
jgi:hypothetical protein